MSAPWEKYQAASDGPWSKYQAPADQVAPDTQESVMPQVDPTASFPEVSALANSPHPVWDALQVPSQMASRGLNAIASALPSPEPTGNIPMDVLKGTPKIAVETLAQVAPGFVSRGSLLTAGASKLLQAARPVGSVVGQGIAGEAESATNAVPGSLSRAWNDPTLIFAKGKKVAGAAYEAGKAELEQGASLFQDMYKPDQIIAKAQDYINKGGTLEPTEALMYRKALDIASRSRNVVKDGLYGMRQTADEMAKASDNISEGDALYRRGLDAESLRRLVPQNKYGGSSAFKMAMMGFLTKALGPAGAGLLSPAVHGALATAGGLAARVATNPSAAVTARQALITQFIDHRTHQ